MQAGLRNYKLTLYGLTGSKFDLLFEVIFKDLAVPAVSAKLALGSWFVLAVGHVLLIDYWDQEASYVAS